MSERLLRFRFFLDNELRSEEWQAADEIESVAARHALDAQRHPGKPWMVEIFDPSAPEQEAYMRLGSAPDGMVAPLAMRVD